MHLIVTLSALASLPALTTGAPTASPIAKRDACSPEPAGVTGYAFDTTSAEGFTGATSFADAASGAATPDGYTSIFSNEKKSSNANDYLGYTMLQSYDVAACAASCTSRKTCQGFNILFERNPSVSPGADCPNPDGVAYIKCVLWGGPVTLVNLVNTGYTNQQFQVVVAGSNGYVKNGIVPPAGYATRQYFGSGAVQANSYVVAQTYEKATLDASACAQKCSQHTAWAAGQPNERPCNFFNVYYQFINDENTLDQMFCVMYDRVLEGSVATNNGQWRGSDWYYVASSYGYSA